MKQSTKRNLALAIVYGAVVACVAGAQHDRALKEDLFEGFDAVNGSASSSSSKERCEYAAPWEKDGGFILYFALMCYIFIGFELICDAFFVPALNVFCEQLKLSDDFAGATLMALGGNAPDIFSGVIGVLVLKTDVGPGTIVGSLLFNHLCIIGCTAIAVRRIKLDMRSCSREMVFYTISIGILVGSLWDNIVTIWEAAIYLITYVVYVVFCWYTPQIYGFFGRKFRCCRCCAESGTADERTLLINPSGAPTSVFITAEEETNSDQEAPAGQPQAQQVPEFIHEISRNPGQQSIEIDSSVSDAHATGSSSSVTVPSPAAGAAGNSSSSSSVASAEVSESMRVLKKKNSDRLKHTYQETYNRSVEDATAANTLESGEEVGLSYGHVLMHGFLTKKSRWYSKLGVTSRTWQRRWFVLSETFWYCRNPLFTEKRVEIPLWKAWKVEVNAADPCEFEVFTPGQTYVLRATSTAIAAKWAAALSRRVEMMKEQNPDLYSADGIAEVEGDDDEENLFAFPSDGTVLQALLWVLSLPYAVLFTFTIPDVRKDKCRKLYVLTFIMVLVWLAAMAYAMVYGADNFARVLCIPEDIMGLTITAMGASLPSLFSSVIAAKQGMANMAISNAFGANLCSILLALGIPMFVSACIDGRYESTSDAIFLAAVVLIIALVIFIIVAAFSKFVLTWVHGIGLLVLYVILLGLIVGSFISGINPFAHIK